VSNGKLWFIECWTLCFCYQNFMITSNMPQILFLSTSCAVDTVSCFPSKKIILSGFFKTLYSNMSNYIKAYQFDNAASRWVAFQYSLSSFIFMKLRLLLLADGVPSLADNIVTWWLAESVPPLTDSVPSISYSVPSLVDSVPSLTDIIPSIAESVLALTDSVPSLADSLPSLTVLRQ
jgi:hypothetical protein